MIRQSCLLAVAASLLLTGCNAPEKLDKEALRAELKAELKAEILAELRSQEPPPARPRPEPRVADDEPDLPADLPGAREPATPRADEPVREPAKPTEPAVDEPVDDPLADAPPSEPAEPAEPADEPKADEPAVAEDPAEPSSKSELTLMTLDIAKGIDRDTRTPVEPGKVFSQNDDKLYAYAIVKNPGEPTTVSIEWLHGDDVKSRLELKVGHSVRGWRTWSTARAKRPGKWSVRVSDESGALVGATHFEVR